MNLYSQRDPLFKNQKLGKSSLTVGDYGCFLCSIATLYQKSPAELLGVAEAFDDQGILNSNILAQCCGGTAGTKTTDAPEGWCIAQTDHYASKGFTQHFFCVNVKTKEQIDPLKFPAAIEPLTFNIQSYRPFTNVALTSGTTPSMNTSTKPASPKKASDRAADRKNKRLQK
jgi:hypothetical protein